MIWRLELGLGQGGALDPDPRDVGLVVGAALIIFTHIIITFLQIWILGRANKGLCKRWLWASVLHPDQFSIMQNQNQQTGA